MLTIYRSNRAEWLAEVLAEQLRLDPPEPFEDIEVMVKTWPTSRWLAEKIASVNGISAKIHFPFPSVHLRKFVQLYLGMEITLDDPWKANRLVWTIIDVLPELIKRKEAKTLLKWLNYNNESKNNEINKQHWSIAKKIAETIEQYILYRPEIINKWWQKNGNLKTLINELPLETRWQPILIHLLKDKINSKPECLQIYDVIRKLKSKEKSKKELPQKLRIFGVNSLAPIQIELIQALSSIIEVKIFLLTPCKDLWKRSRDRRNELGDNWRNTSDGFWLLNSPRLEASLGRIGAEFQQLLEGTGDSQLGTVKEEDLFSLPTAIAINLNKKVTFLEQLQESLITSNSDRALKKEEADSSLLFIASPGQRRQVQLIRDQIIQWLAEDENLQPRDILIMTPQIKQLAPLITSVFSDVEATKVHLPWKITDRSQNEKPGLSKFLVDLIDISQTRLTAQNLEHLLSSKLIEEEFGINTAELEKIMFCLKKSGFHWGVDEQARNGEASNSLSWCLERWIIGIVLPSKPGLAPYGIAPFTENLSFDDLKKWWTLLSKICTYLKGLRKPRISSDWIKYLNSILLDLFNNKRNWSWEHESLYSHIKEIEKLIGNCKFKIQTTVIGEILKKSLSLESGRFGHRAGKITISALEPMRAIPHKIIIIMGLDSSIFPHKETRACFNLLGAKRLLGDPQSTDRDRYILLESLLSAREKLLLTWNCRDEKTGDFLDPPSPIQQWIEYLRNELDEKSFNQLVITPPANPLSSANFISKTNLKPISCDKRNLKACQLINNEIKPKPNSIALPLFWNKNFKSNNNNITNEIARKWITSPQLTWLEKLKINTKEKERNIELSDHLELSELERFNLLKDKYISERETFLNLNQSSISSKEINWRYRLNGQGILPPNAAAEIESEILEARSSNLNTLLKSMGNFSESKIELKNETIEILLTNKSVLVVEIGKIKMNSIMKSWLQHIQVCAYDNCPRETIIISRCNSKNKQNEYFISAIFNKIEKDYAIFLLEELYLLIEQGLKVCWPIPPESGWELAQAKYLNKKSSFEIFKRKWEGSFHNPGENRKSEMELCFGIECKSNILTSNNIFESCLSNLYDPILSNLCLK